MKALIHCVARLYPKRWRDRYATEFDALIDDISPSFRDLCNVLGDVLRVRTTASIDAACLMSATVSPISPRLPVFASVTAHALMISLVLLASWGYVTQMPLHAVAPLPPPIPEPPPQVTDARVFPNATTVYSSLPLNSPGQGDALQIYVADGVGINFLSLPDIGATYRQGDAEGRVWPGQALEGFIVRRVLPEYPHGTKTRGAVSVFVEYLITKDGFVKVLRTSGPTPFTMAAQSAIEHWEYRPLWFEHRPCEVISRVEVRFDSEFAESETSP